MATMYELIKGLQESEREEDRTINAFYCHDLHRQRIEALQIVLDDMPTDLGERVIE